MFGKHKLKSIIQGNHIRERSWISSRDCAVYGQFMRQNVPSNDKKTIVARQSLGIRLPRLEAVQVANFHSDVPTNTLIWVPLRATVLSLLARLSEELPCWTPQWDRHRCHHSYTAVRRLLHKKRQCITAARNIAKYSAKQWTESCMDPRNNKGSGNDSASCPL